jgi:hypothetical protein
LGWRCETPFPLYGLNSLRHLAFKVDNIDAMPARMGGAAIITQDPEDSLFWRLHLYQSMIIKEA